MRDRIYTISIVLTGFFAFAVLILLIAKLIHDTGAC